MIIIDQLVIKQKDISLQSCNVVGMGNLAKLPFIKLQWGFNGKL